MKELFPKPNLPQPMPMFKLHRNINNKLFVGNTLQYVTRFAKTQNNPANQVIQHKAL